LDPALLRPGRIDRKIQYKLATREQATALFLRFFPQSYITFEDSEASSVDEKQFKLGKLAKTFSQGVPEYEFSTAELQGYLLSCKKHPEQAAAGIGVWVEQERIERKERKEREIERKAKEQQSRDEVTQMQFARIGGLGKMSKLGGGRKVGDIPHGPSLKSSPETDESDESDSDSSTNGVYFWLSAFGHYNQASTGHRRTLPKALPGASVESLSLSTEFSEPT
jgi:chaperone BCS1